MMDFTPNEESSRCIVNSHVLLEASFGGGDCCDELASLDVGGVR